MTQTTVTLDLTPDRAMYRPGAPVTLTLTPAAPEALTLHLSAGVDEITTLPVAAGTTELRWTPPDQEGAYGAELTRPDDRAVLAATAFDVHASWLAAPRYGFMADYGPDVEAGRIAALARYHLNALQFYDWQYHHDQHLPEADEYTDSGGRRQSLATVRRQIEEAHAVGMAAMPYTTIYGASAAYGKAHPDQTLYRQDGGMWNFGEDFLMTMNPAEGSGWRAHIMAEYRRVLDALPFDGLHIDQYGDPKVAHDHTGAVVDLAQVMPGFVQEAKALARAYPGRDTVIFNLVGTWPAETVQPSGVDAVYMEIWPPDERYADLRRVITEAHTRSGGRPVLLTAYLSAAFDAGTRLLDAVIAACGASHVELGEDEQLLGDPYFPKYETPSAALKGWLRRYYDVITRYQRYLYTGDPLDLAEQDFGDGRVTGGAEVAGRVWALGRRGADFEVLHLINFVGVPDDGWRTEQPMPSPQTQLDLRWTAGRPVGAVWALSPDQAGQMALPFHMEDGAVVFTVPHLTLWTAIVLTYAHNDAPR